MRPFTYERPDDLAAASRAAMVDEAAFLAGGQSLLRDMKRGLRHHATLVDIGRLVGRAIREDAGTIVIEAGATHAEVASSPLVRHRLPMLAGMVAHIADPQVRHRATIGGALAANEPAGDYPAAALALDATILTTTCRLSAQAFFDGSGRTPLDRGETIVAIAFPIPIKAGYAKILNPAARYAMVGACATVSADGSSRLAITGAAASGAFRWLAAEQALAAGFAAEAIASLPMPPLSMREDLFADAAYGAHLVGIMAARAIGAAGTADPVMVYSHGAPIPGGARRLPGA